jgi:hypothetical protein
MKQLPLRIVLILVHGKKHLGTDEKARDFLTYLSGIVCTEENFEELRQEYKPYILLIYPHLADRRMLKAIEDLSSRLENKTEKVSSEQIVNIWISDLLRGWYPVECYAEYGFFTMHEILA